MFRYIAAIEVIIGHLKLLDVEFPRFVVIPLGLFQGVPLFFGLSGFLIWHSLEKEEEFRVYFRNRFIRIYPELWMAVAVSIVTIIVFYKEKINWLMLGLFTITQSTFLQFWTPDFLRSYGSGTPNGSLWTICTFVQFYIVIYFLHKVLKKASVKIWILIIAVSLIFNITYPFLGKWFPSEALYKLYGQTLLPYLYLFLIGAIVSNYYEIIIPFLKKSWWAFLGVDIVCRLTGYDLPGLYSPIRTICIVLAVIGMAYFIKIRITCDISYELYLFHGIVLNMFMEIGLTGNHLYSLYVVVISVLISILAHYIQKWILITTNKHYHTRMSEV